MNSETHFQDLLSAVTDALLAGDRNIDPIIARYQVSRTQVHALVTIIRRLHVTLVGAQPSHQFVSRLKQDLIGEPEPNVIGRIRRLPPRVQIAAGIALLAGFMLIQRRRMQEYARQEHQIQPEPTPVQ
jgi:hypothetical protein